MHYDNFENVKLDTFNYTMNIVKNQCDHYYNGKIKIDKKLLNAYTTPLALCGVNSAHYDLYFFINLLMKSEYSKRFVSNQFKGHTLICFMLIDTISGKVALKSHDLYQIVLTSLNKLVTALWVKN